jgi:hypothetical protein
MVRGPVRDEQVTKNDSYSTLDPVKRGNIMNTNPKRTILVTLLIALIILMTGCSAPRAAPQPSEPSDTASPVVITETTIPIAKSIAISEADLGEGWVMDAEVIDLNASYYFDVSEDGKAIIGTHRTVTTPAFDPAIVESVVMRGFSNSQQKLTLFHHMVVFKEPEQAVEANKRFQPDDMEEDMPREWTTEYGERHSAYPVAIGYQGVMVIGWLDEDHAVLKTLEYRKGRVWVGLGSSGQFPNLEKFPPMSEDRLEELGRLVEGRIRE